MRRLTTITTLVLLATLVVFTSCQAGENDIGTPIPTIELSPPVPGEEAPDDIMPIPGGPAYRANVHEVGKENPWPEIETTEVVLVNDSKEINVRYRDYIETKAGEVRNNIFYIRRHDGFWDSNLNLYSVDVPTGIEIFNSVGGGLTGTIATVLVIEVSPDVEMGQYIFEISLEIDGEDYGTVPCTIRVLD